MTRDAGYSGSTPASAMPPPATSASSFPRPPHLDERTRSLLADLVAPVPVDRAFPEVEFARAEPAAVLVRLPDTTAIPAAVLEALDALARVCRVAYGGTVEVIADDRDEVREALDLIRRHVDR